MNDIFANEEQMMLMELLEGLENELGIEFSPQEFKQIQELLKNNPNASPDEILNEIFLIIEKKLKSKLELEKKERLKKRFKSEKLFELRAKILKIKLLKKQMQNPLQKTDTNNKNNKNDKNDKNITEKDAKKIVDAAEKKLLKEKKIKKTLDKDQKDKAENYYNKHTKKGDSPLDKANVALLGVVSVGVAGGIRPVVLQNWGNLLNVPDVNPFHGDSILDQGNKIDFQKGDSLGLESRAILNIINTGNIDTSFMQKVEKVFVENSSNAPTNSMSSRTPELKPKNPLDPYG